MTDSRFSANIGGALGSDQRVEVSGSTIEWSWGAPGLASWGGAEVSRSVIANNIGGGLVVSGDANVAYSTITGNSRPVNGGGMYVEGTATVEAVTLVGNSAPSGANVVATVLSPAASVIAQPAGGGGNCDRPHTSRGYNWTDSTSCGLDDPSDMVDVGGDPLLGPLRDNGGPTWTRFPLWGSPLRDAIGLACDFQPDQRGVSRPHPSSGACDIGATEAVYPAAPLFDLPPWVDSAVRWITSDVNDPPLMTGYPDSTFRPDLPITRAQVTRAKYRFAGSQGTAGFDPHGYSDVPAWIETAVTWAANHELVSGYDDGTYRPDANITRGQVARLDERLGLSPWAWTDPDTAPNTLPFRPSAT